METETGNLSAPTSFFPRLTGTLAAPSRTLKNVAHHPRFFAPFLLALALFAGFWGAVYLRLDLSGLAVAVAQYIRRGTLVTQDEIDFVLQFSRALAPLILIGGALSMLLHLLIISWIGSRLANMIFSLRL